MPRRKWDIMDTSILTRELGRAKLKGDVIDRDHQDFNRFRRVWNAMADRRPAVIVRPRTAADVEKTVAVAAEHRTLLAVRGGGHSLPGLSTCDDGIMLDMSLMNTVVVDAAAGRVDVGGGALLGDLDKATVPLGLVVPAGVVSHTGAGGLTLGGGMGWLSRRHGLTIDSLLAAEIVTADGRSSRISADSEPELFWAIRGGGGNFGVITNFTYRTQLLGRVLVGSWVYPPGDTAAVLRRYRDLAARAPRELTTSFVVTSADLLITAIATGDSAPAAAAVAPFGEIGRPLSGAVGAMTFLDLQQRSD